MPRSRPQTQTAAQLKPQTLTTLGFSDTEAAVIVAIAAQVPGIAAAISMQLGDVSIAAQIGASVPAAETRAEIASIISGALGVSVPAIALAAAAAVQLQGQASSGVPAIAASVAAAAIAQGQINAAAPGVASSLAAAAIAQAQVAARVPAIRTAVAAQIGAASTATQIQSAVPAIANAIAAAVVAQAQAAVAAPSIASAIAGTTAIAAQMAAAVPGIASNVAGAIASSYGPLTLDYESRVIAAGGTISSAALNLVEAFFYTAYNDGSGGSGRVADFSSAFPFLWMPVSNFAGILVPLLGANFTNTGFVSGDWNIQSGLQCAAGKHLNSNWATGGFTSTNSAGIGYWTPNTTAAAATQIAIGVAGASGTNGFDMGITSTNLWRSRAYQGTASTNTMAGEKFLYSFRESSTTVGHQRDLVASSVAIGASSVPSLSVFLGARNTNGTATLHWGQRIGAGWATNGVLTVAQRTILYNAMVAVDSGRSGL